MRICENGIYRDLTPEEVASMQSEAERAEAEYWSSIPYKKAVNDKIREKYDESEEFAILRQRDEKHEEYAEYYAYCEECKVFVKAQKAKFE